MAADATVTPVQSMMYRVPGAGDPTTLELKGDGTFRWLRSGCDYGHNDSGRWIEENEYMVFLPRGT